VREIVDLGVEDPAQETAIEHLLDRPVAGMEATLVGDHQVTPGGVGRGDEAPGVVDRRGQGLRTDDVGPGLEGVDGHLGVQPIRRADADQVEALAGQHGGQAGVPSCPRIPGQGLG
jgi:hypothetical protein